MNLQLALQLPCSAEYMESEPWRFGTQKPGSTVRGVRGAPQWWSCAQGCSLAEVLPPWHGRSHRGGYLRGNSARIGLRDASKASICPPVESVQRVCSAACPTPSSVVTMLKFSLCLLGSSDLHRRRSHLLAACRTVSESMPSTGIAVRVTAGKEANPTA